MMHPSIGEKRLGELAEHVNAQQAKGKGPDEIAASLRRELRSPLEPGLFSVIVPFVSPPSPL